MVFGGLTLVLQDDVFIKLKPTIVNTLFGGVLIGGLAVGKPLLARGDGQRDPLIGRGLAQADAAMGLFFFVLAALNEIVWRTQSTDFWAASRCSASCP